VHQDPIVGPDRDPAGADGHGVSAFAIRDLVEIRPHDAKAENTDVLK
jgi:hypothetical protein